MYELVIVNFSLLQLVPSLILQVRFIIGQRILVAFVSSCSICTLKHIQYMRASFIAVPKNSNKYF